ncbi:flagellar assembly protein FliW [Paenibacillus athensensis]|uniref:Flagellar assembly factor FliW n=1 Tax=Paenibacillus athensensis TaxID=1967502 RepID=A0A4Y8Q5H7_9BACL|nr:flagellar assembly protein FliW [Paenibacillus athensensis]MCD1260845.1 flagellar assembly protein FliW [Paenibacillus athensensis]
MKINTLFFGELEVEEQDIFTFSQGVPGFEGLTRYVLVHPEESAPFSYIQSLDEAGLSFLIGNPFSFFDEYDFTLSEAVQLELQIESPDDVAVWSVMTVNEDCTAMTVNLLAPIILNTKARMGKQIILHDSTYRTKHELVLSPADEATSEVEG